MSNMPRGRQHQSHSYHIQDDHSWNDYEPPLQHDQPSNSWHGQPKVLGNLSGSHPKHTPLMHLRGNPYVYLSDGQDDSGTDTDTSSDYCDERCPAAEGATASEQAAEIYWAYSRAKARWRSFMGKPTRKVRRFARRAISKGGKGGKVNQKARSSILHHTFPNSMNPNSWNSSQRSGPREERRVLEAERVRADGEIPEARMDVG